MQRHDLIAAYAIARSVPEDEARQAVDVTLALIRLALERGNGVNIRRFGEFVQTKAGVKFHQGFSTSNQA